MSDIIRASFPGNSGDFRDNIERLESEQADYLDNVVSGPEWWFKDSPWSTPKWGAPGYRFRRTLEDKVYREQQYEARGIPTGIFGHDTSREAAADFLRRLDPAAECFTFQTYDDDRERRRSRNDDDPLAKVFNGSLAKHEGELARLNGEGAGVSVTINATNGKGRRAYHMTRARAVWQEDDNGFPPDSFPLRPSIVVETSPGHFHRYWLLSEELSKEEHKGVMDRMVQSYDSDKSAREFNKAMRLPGFWNRKPGREPFHVRVTEASGARYSRDQILRAFPPPPPLKEESPRPGREQETAEETKARVAAALDCISPDCCRDDWLAVGMALKHEFGEGGWRLWDDWSSGSQKKYKANDTRITWASFKGGNGKPRTIASLFDLAKQNGYRQHKLKTALNGPKEEASPQPDEALDKRPEFPCPVKDGELMPVMKTLDKILLTDEAEPPMRSLLGHPVEVELREPAGFHELTAAGSNDDEAEETRLPPPKSHMLARHNAYTMALAIERYARFFALIKKGKDWVKVYRRLPGDFVKHYLEYKKSKLPRVSGLMTMPIVLPNGKLLATSGLNRDLKIVFCIDPEIVQSLPEGDITDDQIREAMRFLTDEWFADVQTDYAGKCVLIALALSMLERHIFGERPAFFVTAGKRGTGKTTVINMIFLALIGRRAAAAAWSPKEEERRKAVFAALLQNVIAIVWDNVKRGSAIFCPTIEKTLTATELEDRVLGEHRWERAACTTMQVFTGNNIRAKGDLSSRSYNVRLKTERPDPENREFKHPDPFDWTLAHRGKIIRSLYTILLSNPRFKQSAKARAPEKTRFKQWWHLVGAPIEHAAWLASEEASRDAYSEEENREAWETSPNHVDFGKMLLAAEDDDDESADLSEALAALHRRMTLELQIEFKAADVVQWMQQPEQPEIYVEQAEDAQTLADFFAQAGRDKPSPKHIGNKLKEALDAPVSDSDGKTIWTLEVARDKKSASGITRYKVVKT